MMPRKDTSEQDLDALFQALDLNHDGSLSEEELRQALTERGFSGASVLPLGSVSTLPLG
jgi:Ca2+-binding EF-hand superfamily protein